MTDDWRKSTRSDGSDSCVEVRRDRGALRDSKNPGGPLLSCDNVPLLVAYLRGQGLRNP